MEAIKNLRESSALLSNLSFDSYRDVANLIYGYDNVADVCDIISCPSEYVDTLVGMVRYNAELRNKIIYDALDAYATEDDYRAIYAELLAMKQVEGAARELYATMSNNDGRSEEEKEDDILFEAEMDKIFSPSEEKKEERVLTPEEEEAAYDAWYEAEFGNCPCLVIPEEKMILGTTYKGIAEAIYNFEDAQVMVCKKPSENLDIEFVKEVVLGMDGNSPASIAEEIIKEATHWDYRGIYRELYILLQNDIADIDEDIYLHDGVPYSIEMRDGHRVVCPHFEQIIEADEIKEDAFFDEDFDLILNEETGKVEMVADHHSLTAENYEEMERLEADDNFHASLYEADSLPF
jgi:hypothetical protein